MRRLLAVGGLAGLLALVAWGAAVVFAQRGRPPAARRDWPMGLGPLDEVPRRYPPRETSRDAARLVALAAAAGVELTPPYAVRPATPAVNSVRTAMSRYADQQLSRVEDRVDGAPALLARYFAEHEGAIGEVRAYLLQNTAIVWPTDVDATAQAPLPNLGGHMALSRLLVTHALDALSRGANASAEQDLHAAWHLQRDLWHRPELISKAVALSGTRLVNAAVRKLSPPVAWHEEIRRMDYRRSVLAAQQAEVWAIRADVEREAKDPRGVIDFVMQPYDLMCAGNLAAVSRGLAEDLERSRQCAVDGDALDRRIRSMLPICSRMRGFAPPRVGWVWQRLGRARVEIELTSRVLELKSGRPPDLHSDCSDAAWTHENGTLRFSRDIPAPRPQLAIPLEWRR